MCQYGSPYDLGLAVRRASAGSDACLSSTLPLSRRLPSRCPWPPLSTTPPLPTPEGESLVPASPRSPCPQPPASHLSPRPVSSTSGMALACVLFSLPTGPFRACFCLLLRPCCSVSTPNLDSHPCDAPPSQLSSGLCDSPFSALHGPPVLTSSPLLCPRLS